MADLPARPPILCVDFDGVLHSYTSGWKGARNIPDRPVPGAIEWLSSLVSDGDSVCAMAPRYLDFDVCIFSSRNRYIGGARAMRKWLVSWGFPKDKLENLRFPLLKPPAFLLVDDRAFHFQGFFPTAKQMLDFKPWYRRPLRNTGGQLLWPEKNSDLAKMLGAYTDAQEKERG